MPYGTITDGIITGKQSKSLYKKDNSLYKMKQVIIKHAKSVQLFEEKTSWENYFKVEGENLEISDGFHTMDELYEHRDTLFSALGSLMQIIAEEWGKEGHEVWKSKKHSDGTMFDGYFIVGIKKEKGEQITYHIPLKYWDDFCGEILEKAP